VKKSYLYVLIIVVAIVAGGGAWYLLAHNKSDNNMSSMNMNSSHMHASNHAPISTNAVAIQNFAFDSADITVKQGATVTWTNKDSTAHTVTETDSQTGPNSGDVNPGSSYSFTFSTPGTYHYHCAIHPSMVGTVTVTQ